MLLFFARTQTGVMIADSVKSEVFDEVLSEVF